MTEVKQSTNERKVILNDKDMLLLVDLYKENRLLWDVTDQLYKNSEARNAALNNIIQGLDVPVTLVEMRAKLKNLRSTYSRELKKIEKSQACGESYHPKLAWFDKADSFLRKFVGDYIDGRGGVESYSSENDYQPSYNTFQNKSEIDYTPSSNNTSQSMVKIEYSPSNDTQNTSEVDYYSTNTGQTIKVEFSPSNNSFNTTDVEYPQPSSSVQNTTENNIQSSKIKERVQKTPQYYGRRRRMRLNVAAFKKRELQKAQPEAKVNRLDKEDEYELFSKYIAMALRNMPKKEYIKAKAMIQQVITGIELEVLMDESNQRTDVEMKTDK